MILAKRNFVRYVYTLGVMATGVFLGEQFGGFDDGLLWLSLFVVGLGWVVYYHYSIAPRFEYFVEREQDTTDSGS